MKRDSVEFRSLGFKHYEGGAVQFKNVYGDKRYQPVVTESGSNNQLALHIGYPGRQWQNARSTIGEPVLYRSRRRAVRKAWRHVRKLESEQWLRT